MLLSIDPEWATAIYDGDKEYEYRRIPPACDPPFDCVLYETAPTKAVTGEVRVETVVEGAPTEVISETVAGTPHSRDGLLAYFDGASKGAALHATTVTEYDTAVSLEQLQDEFALSIPQNFQYLSDHEYIALRSVTR
ncbi:hypothetical protein [Salinibaculum rarum]|uniref:hypothetical protein n=1 Tax=Salinibaculum rarum TaxID=3058903 RepID=UPI00265E1477|nr:hypothetical protein [Salinibaculum sp. KK48]